MEPIIKIDVNIRDITHPSYLIFCDDSQELSQKEKKREGF
jgi:ribosomal protein S4